MAVPFLQEMLVAFPGDEDSIEIQSLTVVGEGDLPSWFGVSDLAAASIGAAGLKLAQFAGPQDETAPPVELDRRLASLWFGMTLRPQGWQMPPIWDAIAGDYPTKDGWIRLHTNAPHHRAAALSVLGPYNDRAALTPVVAKWQADDLETAIVGAGGCAAVMRDLEAWASHPQGAAASKNPLIIWRSHAPVEVRPRQLVPGRPLAGIKVLDLTRVLAGPVAGRFFAAYGANVLRIDPPDWDEPGVIPEVTLGKRCAGLDLKIPDDRAVFEGLLAEADVLLHGYRPSALTSLGYDAENLRKINPRLIDVSLNAYGWTGPWAQRRGFDSLVQMSCGIAEYGMGQSGADRPVPLPVQALDHATGYLMAAAVLHALYKQTTDGAVVSARLSLARVAHQLSLSKQPTMGGGLAAESEDDIGPLIEKTDWGPARRVKFPLEIDGIAASWDHAASDLRSAPANW